MGREYERAWVRGAQAEHRIIVNLKESLSLSRWSLVTLSLNEVAALTLELFECLVCGPSLGVQLKQLNRSRQSALFKDTLALLRGHKSHLVDDMIIHLNGEEIAHLSFRRHNVFKESDVTDHVLQLVAIVEATHDNAHSTLVFAQKLDTAVLDLVVIHDESAHFY